MADVAVAAPRKTPGEVFDTYLGMLYPTEDFKVYGYISNTRIKFMLVVDEMLQKEDEMRMVGLSQSSAFLAILLVHGTLSKESQSCFTMCQA